MRAGSGWDRGPACSSGHPGASTRRPRRQGQGHRHLVDVDGPLLEEVQPVEEPAGPFGPCGGDPGEEGTGDEVEPSVAVPPTVRWSGPRGGHLAALSPAASKMSRITSNGGTGASTDFPATESGGAVADRGSSRTTTSVSQRTTSPRPVVSQPERAGDLVAMGRAGVEAIDRAHGDASGLEVGEGVRGLVADHVHHQIARVGAGDDREAVNQRRASRWNRG